MRNKRLVAAMAALSLAVTPTRAWAYDLNANPLDAETIEAALGGGAREDEVTADGMDAPEQTEDAAASEESAAAQEGDSATSGETVVPQEDESAVSDVALGQDADQHVDETDPQPEQAPEVQAVVELSGMVSATELDAETDYVLVGDTTIDMAGRNLELRSLATGSEGINHSLTVTGGGALSLGSGLTFHQLSVTGGATVGASVLDGVYVMLSGGSTLSAAHVAADEGVMVGAGCTLYADLVETGELTTTGAGARVVTDQSNVYALVARAGGNVESGSIGVQRLEVDGAGTYVVSHGDASGRILSANVTNGATLEVWGSLVGMRLEVSQATVEVGGDASMSGATRILEGARLVTAGTVSGSDLVATGTVEVGGAITMDNLVTVGGVVTSAGPTHAGGVIEVKDAGILTAHGNGEVAIAATGDIVGDVYIPHDGLVISTGDRLVVADAAGTAVRDRAVLYAPGALPDVPSYFLEPIGDDTWVVGSEGGLYFGTDAERSLIVAVEIDGIVVEGGLGIFDVDDNTVIALAARVLDSLESGAHTLTVRCADGAVASTAFAVTEPAAVDHVITSGHGGVWVRGSGVGLSFGTSWTEDPLGVLVDGAPIDRDDYTLDSVTRVGERTVTLTDEFLSTLATGDHTVTVRFTETDDDTAPFVVRDDLRDYRITSGNGSRWEQGSESHLTFVTDGHEDDLAGVIVNGRTLVEGEDYLVHDAEADAVGVALTDEFLDTLAIDEHEILVAFDDGDAEGNFFVVSQAADGTVDDASSGLGTRTASAWDAGSGGGLLPKTGDPAVALGGVVGAGALSAIAGVALRRRRDKTSGQAS